MEKILLIFLLIITLISACSQYDNEDVVAIVGNEEITIADVRLFYNLEKKELNEAVKDYVKEEIMVQEAKRMGLDVSERIEEQRELNTPFPLEQTKEQEEYAQKEAKELGMTEEDYYERYINLSIERSAYIMAFIEERVGKIQVDDDSELYTEKVNKFVDNLLIEHSEDIEILIK